MKKITMLLFICLCMGACACKEQASVTKGPGQEVVETYIRARHYADDQKALPCVPPELGDRLSVSHYDEGRYCDPEIVAMEVLYNRQIWSDEIERIKRIYKKLYNITLEIQEAHEYHWRIVYANGEYENGSFGGINHDHPMLAVKIRDHWYAIPYNDD